MAENGVHIPDITMEEIVSAFTTQFPLELRVVVSELRAAKMADLYMAQNEGASSHLTTEELDVQLPPEVVVPDGVVE